MLPWALSKAFGRSFLPCSVASPRGHSPGLWSLVVARGRGIRQRPVAIGRGRESVAAPSGMGNSFVQWQHASGHGRGMWSLQCDAPLGHCDGQCPIVASPPYPAPDHPLTYPIHNSPSASSVSLQSAGATCPNSIQIGRICFVFQCRRGRLQKSRTTLTYKSWYEQNHGDGAATFASVFNFFTPHEKASPEITYFTKRSFDIC